MDIKIENDVANYIKSNEFPSKQPEIRVNENLTIRKYGSWIFFVKKTKKGHQVEIFNKSMNDTVKVLVSGKQCDDDICRAAWNLLK